MFSGVMDRNSPVSQQPGEELEVTGYGILVAVSSEYAKPLLQHSPPCQGVAASGKLSPGGANPISVQLRSSLIFWFLQEKNRSCAQFPNSAVPAVAGKAQRGFSHHLTFLTWTGDPQPHSHTVCTAHWAPRPLFLSSSHVPAQ